MKKRKRFKPQTPLTEVLEAGRIYNQILISFGLHCYGCPLTAYETIEQAAQVHGIDLDFLLEKLNQSYDEE